MKSKLEREKVIRVYMMTNRLPCFEYAKYKAYAAAREDYLKGIGSDSSRHYAKPNSAFDQWYNEKFSKLAGTTHQYRIITREGKIKFAGTDTPSWMTLESAKDMAEDGDMVYEFDDKGNRLWEIL